jgi:hypothetical protein
MLLRGLMWLGLVFVLGCTQGIVADLPDASPEDIPETDLGTAPRCGAARQPCCGGRACNRQMECEQGLCCGRAGAECSDPLDCCSSFGCAGGRCCVDLGGLCEGASECCTGGVCVDGVCERADDCGARGQRCCAGNVCSAGHTCQGALCVACGVADAPCCDGTECGTGLACQAGTCRAPAACGAEGEPCCNGLACERGTECRQGRCAVPDACGFVNQPCCPGSSCSAGNVCQSGRCVAVTSTCGGLGRACCTGGSCEGDLNCSNGTCARCTASGSECRVATDCCGDFGCRPTPVALRCCHSAGQSCANSLDCCGYMLCDETARRCTCQAVGSACTYDGECCNGATCEDGLCRAAVTCRTAGTTGCTMASECCTGLLCAGSPHAALLHARGLAVRRRGGRCGRGGRLVLRRDDLRHLGHRAGTVLRMPRPRRDVYGLGLLPRPHLQRRALPSAHHHVPAPRRHDRLHERQPVLPGPSVQRALRRAALLHRRGQRLPHERRLLRLDALQRGALPVPHGGSGVQQRQRLLRRERAVRGWDVPVRA